jgi:hypothetical protein
LWVPAVTYTDSTDHVGNLYLNVSVDCGAEPLGITHVDALHIRSPIPALRITYLLSGSK